MPTDEQPVTRTIRLRAALVRAADQDANELGLSFNDIVDRALAAHLQMPHHPAFDLLQAIRGLLLEKYPDRLRYPQTVTLEVFRDIRARKDLWSLYEAATTDEEGRPSEPLRDALHRRIGRAVKAILGAKVVGRSLPLDPEKELIRSHALLQPSTDRAGGESR